MSVISRNIEYLTKYIFYYYSTAMTFTEKIFEINIKSNIKHKAHAIRQQQK